MTRAHSFAVMAGTNRWSAAMQQGLAKHLQQLLQIMFDNSIMERSHTHVLERFEEEEGSAGNSLLLLQGWRRQAGCMAVHWSPTSTDTNVFLMHALRGHLQQHALLPCGAPLCGQLPSPLQARRSNSSQTALSVRRQDRTPRTLNLKLGRACWDHPCSRRVRHSCGMLQRLSPALPAWRKWPPPSNLLHQQHPLLLQQPLLLTQHGS